MPDTFEVAEGLDRLDPADGGADADGDGLTNFEEYRRGTDLHNEDTDEDLLVDGLEVLVWGTDPLFGDTDGDFSLDGSEVELGTDPLNSNEKPGTPFTPSFKTTTTLTGVARRVAARTIAQTDHVYVISGDGKISPFVIQSSTYLIIGGNPKFLSADLRDIQVVGKTAYVAAGAAGLHLVDLTVPANPALSSTMTGFSPVSGVAATKALVLLATDVGLWVLGRQADGTLQNLGSLSIPAFSRLAVCGSMAYLGVAGLNRLILVDISDPTSPREVQRFAMPASTTRFQAIEATDRHVYVAHGSAGLIALSGPDPAHLAISDTSAPDFGTAAFDALSLIGNRLPAYTPTDAARAQLYKLVAGGLMEPVGGVQSNAAGASQLITNQNYVASLASGSLSLSEILPKADRVGNAPVGQILLENSRDLVVRGEQVYVRGRARDDIYVESVEFFVGG